MMGEKDEYRACTVFNVMGDEYLSHLMIDAGNSLLILVWSIYNIPSNFSRSYYM